MKIIVSACLLGENCKYNGGNNYDAELAACLKEHEVIAVCPEVLGGLPVPRVPSEIVNGVVMSREGKNVDREFRLGAEIALEKALEEGAELAVLQSRSPSCGVGQIYDGSFSGRKKEGNGIFAELLLQNGVKALDAAEFQSAIEDVIP